jgi:Bacterial archaeo-eukaryotic release factor family 3
MTQKITLLTIESLTELTSVHQPPCLSLYQPTHRRHPGNQQDPIRFRNLVKELETALRQKVPAVETRLLVEPFEDVARDHAFWNHTLGWIGRAGRAEPASSVPASAAGRRIGRRGRQLSHQALTTFSTIGRGYQVLGLSLQKIQLFEGNRDALDEIDPAPGVPRTITEALAPPGNE